MASTTPDLCPNCFGNNAGEDPCPRCGLATDAPRPANALPLGTVLNGQFVIGRVLGKPGGFGITYLALDRNLRARVAIKEYLPRDLATRGADRATILPHTEDESGLFRFGLGQFLTEAQTLAQLDHPNIVRVRQFFEANRSAYLVMDYYRGMTLAEFLDRQRDGRMPEDKAIALMQPVLDGLRAVHAQGFLHRDIKPGNLYLAQTDAGGVRPILLDFGAARQAVGDRSHSLSVVLTEGYAPFEQYHRKGKQGPWTDIYAAAAVLYRMLTGQDPDAATDRQSEDTLTPAARFGVSKAVSDVLAVALSVRPERRPQKVEDFQRLLHDAQQGIGPLPVTGPPQPSAPADDELEIDLPNEIDTGRTNPPISTPKDGKERDYRAIIGGRATGFYLKRFRRIDANAGEPTAGWNWPAFLFGTLWCWYRRMWLTGAGLFVVEVFAYLVVWALLVEGLLVGEAEADAAANLLSAIPVRILFGMYANWFYHRRAERLIRKADTRFPTDAVARSGFLQSKGGTSSVVIWLLLIFIVGILAAIAIPSYMDYVAKARISEVLGASAPYRAAVDQHVVSERQWPQSLARIDQPVRIHVGGVAVDVSLGDEGELTFTFADDEALGGLSLVLYPLIEEETINWYCTSPDIRQDFLPTQCRD
jgi:serine/threonine protein kinase